MIKEGHNDTIIASLSSGSIILEGLQSSFTAVSDRFAYSTLLEEREYPEIGKIVDDESASLYLPRETRNSIPANHADIARFSRPNEIGFKRVINGLKNLLRATARMSSRHHSTSAPPAMSDMSSIPYTERGFSPYDYGRYTPGRGIPFNDPSLYNRDPRFAGYGRDRMSPYDDPAYDERGLPIMLNRVSISQAALGGNPPITAPTAYHSKEDEVAPDETPAMPAPEKAPCVEEQPAAANGNEEQGKEENSHEKPEAPAASGEGQAAGGEEAEEVERGEEGGKEEEEEEEEHFPSPVTRDMFVRLSQEVRRSYTEILTFYANGR